VPVAGDPAIGVAGMTDPPFRQRPAQSAGRSVISPLLQARDLTKIFPGVRALDNVDFSVAPGEIVALLGQNGAGKSTLIQIFAGAHAAGSYVGTIDFQGRPYRPFGIADGEAAGIALVPQEINILPELTVAENITLNREPTRWGVIDVARRLQIAKASLAEFELDVNSEARMSSLDLATQQLVVIARAMARDARLLILDEPTAALTERESERLFDRMRVLKAHGVAIIFVSHRLSEIFAISDRIVVMRDGRIRGSHFTSDVSRQQIVSEMIGTTGGGELQRSASPMLGSVALELRDLRVFDAEGRLRVNGLNLSLRTGEVVGLFGLLGAGCIEAALAVYGAYPGTRKGQIVVDGVVVRIDAPADAVASGLGLIAQDRRDSLIAGHSVEENIVIASLETDVRNGVRDPANARRRAQDQANALNIRTASVDAEVQTLSGGNQQKVQIARWLAADARILIMIDPTRGVDVGARREVKAIWSDLTQGGHAMLVASTDVEELVDVCNRVVVMNSGKQVGELSGTELTESNLVRMASDG